MTSFRVVLIVLTALMFVYCGTDEPPEEDHRECGQYGFKCLDEKTLEFCPIVVDGITEKSVIYECDDDFTCDEDNPAYCTPKEPPNKLIMEANKEKESSIPGGAAKFAPLDVDAYDDVYFDEESYYKRARLARANNKDDDCSCESTTIEVPTTTDADDGSEFTTVNFTPPPPFECDSYGFFADKSNDSLFWYCDVPLNGVGFLLRHMVCGHGRHFDETLRNCILQGTVRLERKDNSDCSPEVKKDPTPVNCFKKKPGKYPDPSNPRLYHLCLPKQFSPAVQLTFMCPRGTAYDVTCRSCSVAAFNRTQTKPQPPVKGKINCRSPTRFRSVEDCSSYFLCFVDNVIEIKCPKFYKFDDMALECLPEKVAECKEYTV